MALLAKKFVVGSLFVASLIYAGGASAGWAPAGKVTRIHAGTTSDNGFYFSTETQVSVSGCGNTAGYFVSTANANDAAVIERVYSLLLTAYTAGLPVSIFTNGTCGGFGSRPVVTTVQFRDPSINYH